MDRTINEIKLMLLFRAVLKQAAKDAFILKTSKKNKKESLEFLKGGKDLEFVCDVADVDYDDLVDEMKNLSDVNNKNYEKILNKLKNRG